MQLIRFHDEIKNLNNSVEIIINSLAEQEREIEKLTDDLARQDRITYDTYGFKAVKRILFYISQGIEEGKATALAYDDMKDYLTMRHIQELWKIYRASKNGLLLYGRAYTAHKMKSAGFKPYEIAQVLGVPITTVNKILKSSCICD